MKTRIIGILPAAALAVLLAACALPRSLQSDYRRGYHEGVAAHSWGGLTRTYYENRDNPEWSRGYEDGFWGYHWRMHGEGGGAGGGGGGGNN